MLCPHDHERFKLPRISNLEMIKCAKLSMDSGEEYLIKINDIVAIQFIRPDNQIVIRKGRIHDIVLVNKRELSTKYDNVSRIILDCSEQFSVKTIEIKFIDIIKIGDLCAEFEDYSDRITHLEPNFIDDCRVPVRDKGTMTKEEVCELKKRICHVPSPEIPTNKLTVKQQCVPSVADTTESTDNGTTAVAEDKTTESISGYSTGTISARGMVITE